MPEDPQGARDDEGGRDKNVGDEMAGDNRVFDPAWWLADDVFIDRFHAKTAAKTNVPIFFQILEIIALDYNDRPGVELPTNPYTSKDKGVV